ncbi:hypothetical protein HK096_005799 [Nowakowskiella sp. JEL0078]|nr:hypothetical protein HK096_005799 [Nowakowskiella sp. JEL0078]
MNTVAIPFSPFPEFQATPDLSDITSGIRAMTLGDQKTVPPLFNSGSNTLTTSSTGNNSVGTPSGSERVVPWFGAFDETGAKTQTNTTGKIRCRDELKK